MFIHDLDERKRERETTIRGKPLGKLDEGNIALITA